MIRIALIHALAHTVEPTNDEFNRQWPQALRMNLLDDSLSADLAKNTASGADGLDAAMHVRFENLATYAESTGAQAILFTCSAFGPCIDAVAARRPHMPVLKPNQAMVAEAVALGGRIGLIATFAPTLTSMVREFPQGTDLVPCLVAEALSALERRDLAEHDRLIVQAARELVKQGCQAIALAQFSMARASAAVEAAVKLPVLTTPGSVVRLLKQKFQA